MNDLNEALHQLDTLYGELKRSYEHGDLSLADVARIQVDTMLLIGRITVVLQRAVVLGAR